MKSVADKNHSSLTLVSTEVTVTVRNFVCC